MRDSTSPSTPLADAAVRGVAPIRPAFLTHEETATYLGIPEATLYQLEYRNVAPRSYKIGRHRKYRLADVEAWCEARASGPVSTA